MAKKKAARLNRALVFRKEWIFDPGPDILGLNRASLAKALRTTVIQEQQATADSTIPMAAAEVRAQILVAAAELSKPWAAPAEMAELGVPGRLRRQKRHAAEMLPVTVTPEALK